LTILQLRLILEPNSSLMDIAAAKKVTNSVGIFFENLCSIPDTFSEQGGGASLAAGPRAAQEPPDEAGAGFYGNKRGGGGGYRGPPPT